MRIPDEIAKRVVLVGPEFIPPQGGIASVLKIYHDEIFPANQFHFIPTVSVSTSKFSKVAQLLKALRDLRLLARNNHDVSAVHIHTASYISFIRASFMASAARKRGLKVVMHMHSGYFERFYHSYPHYVRRTLEKCDRVVALSDKWSDFYRNEIGLKNVVTIPNAIASPVFISHDRKTGYPLHLLFLGLIKPEKGIFDLVDVIAEHRHEWKGKIILHIGGKQNEDLIKRKIADSSLDEMVILEGWVDAERKKQLFNSCDVFALPSYFEGVPISILEAMSYEMPIVASNVGGIPSIVKTGENGCLVEPGDRQTIFNAINAYVERPDLLHSQGARSKEISADYLPSVVAERLTEMYQNIIFS